MTGDSMEDTGTKRDDSEWTGIIELDRRQPFYFPELGLAVTTQRAHKKDRVRVILRKMRNNEYEPRLKGLTSRRRKV